MSLDLKIDGVIYRAVSARKQKNTDGRRRLIIIAEEVVEDEVEPAVTPPASAPPDGASGAPAYLFTIAPGSVPDSPKFAVPWKGDRDMKQREGEDDET